MDCILHIGTDKTGSTSLQAALAANRSRLLEQGVLYPQTGAMYGVLGSRHAGLRLAFETLTPQQFGIQKRLGLTDEASIASYPDALIAKFDQEISGLPMVSRVMISDEDLFRSSDPKMIRGLHTFLLSRFSRVTVVVYLRDLIPYLISDYSQQIKMGRTYTLEEWLRRFLAGGGISARLQLWVEMFGSEQVRFLPFSHEALHGGEVVSDFCHRFDLRLSEYQARCYNRSLSPTGISLLRWVNTLFPQEQRPSWLRKLVQTGFTGDASALAKQIPDALLAQLNEEQRRLRQWLD